MGLSTTAALLLASSVAAEKISVPRQASSSSVPFDGFVSYSIEFAFFPDYSGNHSEPNVFSDNLLNNLGTISGTKPLIRVGGNTQDYALYNASLPVALVGTYNPARSTDYPTTIQIGPSYFEGYSTWPGVKYSHGLNLGLGGNNSAGWETLVQTVPLACKALSNGNLYTWEYGNEPDLYSTSSQGPVRPPTWNESTYDYQWHNGTAEIQKQVEKYCPELARQGQPRFMAPSFAGTSNHLKAPLAFKDGLDKYRNIELFSTHNYISGAESPGVTLQGTLMNHTSTMASVDAHIVEYNNISSIVKNAPPLMFGECNSLYNEGRPGLSNTFGAALWGVDFNLYSASVGFKRVHMHQGTDYRYQAWQPVTTANTSIGTKAPYYGNVAVSSMLRNAAKHPVTISSIPLKDSTSAESAYAAHYATNTHYRNGPLARIMVINMNGYNTTVDGAGLQPVADPPKRGSKSYTFGLEGVRDGVEVYLQRLMANGSDAITGCTFDGWSYNYDLDMGKPVRLHNVTIGEKARVRNGEVTVEVPDSSALLLNIGSVW